MLYVDGENASGVVNVCPDVLERRNYLNNKSMGDDSCHRSAFIDRGVTYVSSLPLGTCPAQE